DAERLVGMHDGDVRRAEEVEILQRLFGVTHFVAAGDAERIVELEAAFAPPLQMDPAIFSRERKIAGVRLAAGGYPIHQIAEFCGRRARGDLEPPRLAVAPRRGLLRRGQDPLD